MALSSLQLEAFAALAQTRHFTKAAEKLHVTQSALSQRILNLEEDLETTLFIRDRSGVQLTEIAHELLRYCQTKDLLEAEFVSRLKARDSGELRGVVRIAGFSSVMRSVVMPALDPLISRQPELMLECMTGELEDLPDLLRRGSVDFIIMDRELQREELESVVLGHERNVLVEKKGYKGPDLYLDHDERDETTVRYLKLARKKTTGLQRRFLDDVYGLLDGVRMGWGRAVLPLHLIEGISGLKVLQPEIVLELPVVLHSYRQPYVTRLHQKVREALESGGAGFL